MVKGKRRLAQDIDLLSKYQKEIEMLLKKLENAKKTSQEKTKSVLENSIYEIVKKSGLEQYMTDLLNRKNIDVDSINDHIYVISDDIAKVLRDIDSNDAKDVANKKSTSDKKPSEDSNVENENQNKESENQNENENENENENQDKESENQNENENENQNENTEQKYTGSKM